MAKRRVRRSAEETRALMVAEGVRQLQERGVGLGVEHITLEGAFVALDIPRSSSHAAWSIDENYSPQELFRRAVLQQWLLNRESSIFADSTHEAVAALCSDPEYPPSEGSIIRTAIQAAFSAGIAPTRGEGRGDGDFLSTDLALRFAIASQPISERDEEIAEWVRAGEKANREERVDDSFRPLAELLGYRPKPEFGDDVYRLFAIVAAALVEGIGLRHRLVPEWELDQPLTEAPEGEADVTLIGLCMEALVPVFFERVPEAG